MKMVVRLTDPDPFSLGYIFIAIGLEDHPPKTFSEPVHFKLQQDHFPTNTLKLNRTLTKSYVGIRILNDIVWICIYLYFITLSIAQREV